MNTEEEVKKYLKKYFESDYINERDSEFKALIKIINKAKSFAQEEKKKEAIAFSEWHEINDWKFLELYNVWYHKDDHDCSNPKTSNELYDIYLKDK